MVYKPQLCINYSPQLDLRLRLARVQRHEAVLPEYFFEVKCRVRNHKGYFEYLADELCFEPRNFEEFARDLQLIQQGTSGIGALKNVGEMFMLQLEYSNRKLSLRLDAREYSPGLTRLNTALRDLEYDLFVNKLLPEVEQFLYDLASLEPEIA